MCVACDLHAALLLPPPTPPLFATTRAGGRSPCSYSEFVRYYYRFAKYCRYRRACAPARVYACNVRAQKGELHGLPVLPARRAAVQPVRRFAGHRGTRRSRQVVVVVVAACLLLVSCSPNRLGGLSYSCLACGSVCTTAFNEAAHMMLMMMLMMSLMMTI